MTAMKDKAVRVFPNVREEISALKRERIVDAAVETFYQNGYENSTLESVASLLQVTKPFIYAHFSSKAELLAEVCSRAIAASNSAIDGVVALDMTATNRLRLLNKRFVQAVIGSQKHIAIFTREEKNLLPADFERINTMRRHFDGRLTSLLEEGMAAKEFRLLDANLAALAIGGMVSWIYVWYREGGRLQPEDIADRFNDLILGMVGADIDPRK